MISDDAWVPPAPPPFLADLGEADAAAPPRCGAAAARHFLLEEGWTFVNHGAFGSPLARAFEAASRWRRHAELQPLRFIDRELFPYLVKVTKLMAAHVRADPRDLVLLPNATSALNAVIQSVPLGEGDSVLFFDCTYASVKKMVRKVCKERGAVAAEKKLPALHAALTAQELADAVSDLIPDQCRLVVLDHITSNEALLLPLDLLVPLCQSRGALVLVDGAHGLAATDLDLAAIGADYYAGNCHKWFCAPRGVGFLHVNHARLRQVAPAGAAPKRDIPVVVCSEKTCERVGVLKATQWACVDNPITSHGYGAGFLSQFVWDGARDYSAFLALEACLHFWHQFPAAAEYARQLVAWAGGFLSRRWDTTCLLGPQLTATMALVLLPPSAQAQDGAVPLADAARALQDALFSRLVECPVKVPTAPKPYRPLPQPHP